MSALKGDAPEVPGCTDLVEVGRGGFAVVYRARQLSFDRDVAVKVISRAALVGDTTARFVRECRAIGALSWHPNVVTVYDAGTTAAGNAYLVMAWLEGGSLADEVAKGPLPPRRVAEIGLALAGALEASHRAGRLHRDVKPENVLVGPLGEPQLADFGIAAVAGQTITTDGPAMFSPQHVPPELISGKDPDVRSDVYSLASTLYTLLAGRSPFERATDTSMLPLLSRIAFDAPPDLRPGVPAPVWEVIAAGLAKDPTDRPPSAEEFATRLRSAALSLGWDVPPPVVAAARRSEGGTTVAGALPPPLGGAVDTAAESDGGPQRDPAARRSRKWLWARLGVAGVLLVTAAALALGTGRLDQPRAVGQVTPRTGAASDAAIAVPDPEAPGEGRGGDPEELLADSPAGYRLRPGTQQLRAQAVDGARRIDPEGETVTETATAQVLKGDTPVALAIAYGLTPSAANPLVVEDRIVASALDPGAARDEGSPPTWRGQVTGTDGETSAAVVLLADDVALLLLASDQAALDEFVEALRPELA